MADIAAATFEVTGWDEEPYDDSGPTLARATVTKTYRGDLEGEATAELLTCQADPDDYAAGAGYVASEVVAGAIAGRTGTFVVQHGGLAGGDHEEHTFGSVVPGSATGELVGLGGTVEISVDDDGTHRLELRYRFDAEE